jgi:acyl carrier protein
MERSEVLDQLRERAQDVLGTQELGGADSLAVVELAMDVEDAFGIELTEAEVSGAGSLEDLADLVLAKVP